MRITTRVIISVLVAAAFLLTGFAVSEAADKPTIKIGWSIPLTGDLGWIGEGMKQAVELARDEIGATNYNWEVLYEDDKLDAKTASTIANKYVHVDKVDITVTAGGSCGNALAKIADRNGILNFTITTDPGVTEGVNNFGHWTPLPEQNIVMVEQVKKRGFKKPAAFVNVSLSDYVAIWKDLGTRIDLIATGEIQNDQKDFRTEIAKVLQSKPDLIFTILRPPLLEILTKQLRELGYKGALTSVESFAASKEKELFEGEFFVGGAETTQWFRKNFEAKFGKEPGIGAANAYDIIKLLVFAVENAGVKGKPSIEQISASLKRVNYYPGALGTLRIQPNGRVWSAATVQMIKNGEVIHIDP